MNVFVYGTLTDPERADAVLDEFAYRGPALLDGLHRVNGDYPTLAPGGTVRGRILATDDVASLDSYEGVDSGLYVRVSIPVSSGTGGAADAVQTYVGDPDALVYGRRRLAITLSLRFARLLVPSRRRW